MYIERLTVENFKGFERAQIELSRVGGGHAGWHVLAGRNGAGKSSVLRAIALALRAENYAFRLLPDFPTGQLRRGAKVGRIMVDVVRDPMFDQFDDGHAYFTSQADDHEVRPPFNPADDPDDPINDPPPDRLEFGVLMNVGRRGSVHAWPWAQEEHWPGWPRRGPWLAQPQMGWMIAGYGPLRRLQGHSSDALGLMKESSGVASLVTLFSDDASLAEATVWLREVAVRQRSAVSLEALLDLLNDGLMPDGMTARRVDDDGALIVEQAGVELPLEQLSDGYRAVAALVFDLVYRIALAYGEAALGFEPASSGAKRTLTCPGVVLIDEAETHLHPSWQKKLGFWLVEHFPNIQFIVTTHSPFICQAAVHGSLTRLSPPGDPRPPERLDGQAYWTVVNGSPDEAMLTELFGLEQLISDDAEALREQIAELEVREDELSSTEQETLDHARAKLPGRPGADLDVFKRMLEKFD